ncbi:hypothetical protein HY449_02785 [Candidatus Pacearchaeota archaeon]|nr:hypothetical protein [Candidatus Pacearchaeota archaeon]
MVKKNRIIYFNMKISGAELDFYRHNRFRIRAKLENETEEVGYVGEYLIKGHSGDGYMVLGTLPVERCSAEDYMNGNFCKIDLKDIKSLEAAAISEIENSSLSDDTRREILGFLKR